MDSDHTAPTERLWTPWRMNYIGGNAQEEGCIFCNRLAADHDAGSLILHRGPNTFSIMNLYPYNTGHIMLVPNHHAAEPEDLSRETLQELGTTLPLLTSVLRRVFECDGFNVGLNIGSVAGAGVASHLHQHIVPRWQGDANFMPILASTMVVPEMIPVTYAKIRAEIEREITRATYARIVLFDRSGEHVLSYRNQLPNVPLESGQSVWKSVVNAVPPGISDLEIAGWAGADSTRNPDSDLLGLTLRGTISERLNEGWGMSDVESEEFNLESSAAINRAQALLAPAI